MNAVDQRDTIGISGAIYDHDLISWSAIGARTTYSQIHREVASGLSSPVGFKNVTNGGLAAAVNALLSVAYPHRFLGINSDGEVAIFETSGNDCAHTVLREDRRGPNYHTEHSAKCAPASGRESPRQHHG